MTFDDGKKEIGISGPEQSSVKGVAVEKTAFFSNMTGIIGKIVDGELRVVFFHLRTKIDTTHAADMRHGDNEIVVVFFDGLNRLFSF